MWDLKKMIQMNYFTETDSQTLKKKKKTYSYQRGKGRRAEYVTVNLGV